LVAYSFVVWYKGAWIPASAFAEASADKFAGMTNGVDITKFVSLNIERAIIFGVMR
jgi:hypothetical protein